MYLKLDNNFITVMSKTPFEGCVEAPEPSDDVIKWFAVNKYLFINNKYETNQGWSEPTIISPDEL